MRARLAATLAAILAGCLLAGCTGGRLPAAQPSTEPDSVVEPIHLGRGVNILSDDPIWGSRQAARLTERHLALIRQAGFDHVRINLHPFRDGALDPDPAVANGWFDTVRWAVNAALANQLAVVLDVHEYAAMGRDPVGHHEAFLEVWRELSRRFHDEPPTVAFELLNEPNGELTTTLWNDYLQEALRTVRAIDPTRTVIVGTARSSRISALDELQLPDSDRHLIVTVHYYLPFEFTHQGAPWAGLEGRTGVRWTGTAEQREAISTDLAEAQSWALQHDRPMYLGEFGAYEAGDISDRAAWTAFVAREAERLGWSWAYWQFDSDFVVYDVPADRWIAPIRDALIPEGS